MNVHLLKLEMYKKGITQKKLAESIGISTNSMCRKLNGTREFTISEANNIAKVLNLGQEEKLKEIFF